MFRSGLSCVLSDCYGAFAALIVQGGVWLVGGEAHAVGCFFSLNGASEAARNDKEGAERVWVSALFPFVGKERLACEVLVEFLCKFDPHVANYVFFELFSCSHCNFLQLNFRILLKYSTFVA